MTPFFQRKGIRYLIAIPVVIAIGGMGYIGYRSVSEFSSRVPSDIVQLYQQIETAAYHDPIRIPLGVGTMSYGKPFGNPPKSEASPGFIVRDNSKSTAIQIVDFLPSGVAAYPKQTLIRFNVPMVKGNTHDIDPKSLGFKITPHIAGTLRWINQTDLVYDFLATPNMATRYRVSLNKPLTPDVGAADSDSIDADLTFEFETVRPAVESVLCSIDYGANGGVTSANPEIYVSFNTPMSRESVETHAFFLFKHASGETSYIGAKVAIVRKVPEALSRWRDPAPRNTLKIMPKETLHPNAEWTLVIFPGALPKKGNLGSLAPLRWGFKTTPKAQFLGIHKYSEDPLNPYSNTRIVFASPVSIKELAASIRTYPAVKLDFGFIENGQYSNTFAFPIHALAPSQNYVVYFVKPIRDIYGEVTRPAPYILHVTHKPPYVGYLGNTLMLERDQADKLPLQVRNMATIEVEISELTRDQDLIGAYQRYIVNSPPSQNVPVLDVVWQENFPTHNQNQDYLIPLTIQRHLGHLPKAPVLVKIKSAEGLPLYSIVQFSNIGISSKMGDENGLIWTTKIKEGKPYPGVSLSLINPLTGKVLWSGKSNKEGLVYTPGRLSLGTQIGPKNTVENLIVVATVSDDKSFASLSWTQGISKEEFGLIQTFRNTNTLAASGWKQGRSDYFYAYSGYWAQQNVTHDSIYVFLQRPLYTPGESVDFKAILRRDAFLAPKKLAQGESVVLTIYDPTHKEIFKKTYRINGFSSFSGLFKLPEFAALGVYEIQVVSAFGNTTQTFVVDEFKKKNFTLSLKASGHATLFQNTMIRIEGLGRYFHGGAMGKHRMTYSVYGCRDYMFRPLGYAQFEFDYQDPEMLYQNQSDQDYLKQGDTFLQSDGSFSVLFKPKKTLHPFVYTGVLTVYDATQDFQSVETQFLVHPASFYLGSYVGTRLVPAGQVTSINIVAVDVNNTPVLGSKVTVTTWRKEMDVVRQKGNGNMFVYAQKPKLTKEKTSHFWMGKSSYRYAFVPRFPGDYTLVFASEDSQGRQVKHSRNISVYGPGDPQWRLFDHDRIELLADKDLYSIGDSAMLLIKSPFASGQALVTVEREGVLESYLFTIKDAATAITLPIKKSYFPNVYVGVTLIQGRVTPATFHQIDLGKPTFRVGYTQLKVEDKSFRLHVQSTPSAAQYKPGDRVSVTLKVTDAAGKGCVSELAIAVVDESLLALMPYDIDPYSVFFADRPLTVSNAENRVYFYGRRHFGQKGINLGGGGGGDMDVDERKKFLNAAYWNPSVVTAKDGTATVSFILPDNLTTYKIMVVAQSSENQFGHGVSSFKVSKNLALFSSFPAFLNQGDEVYAGVQVFNNSKQKGIATVLGRVENARMVDVGEKQIVFKDQIVETALYHVQTKNPGVLRYHFQARFHGNQDAFSESIPVYPLTHKVSSSFYGVLNAEHPSDKVTTRLLPHAGTPDGDIVIEIKDSVVGEIQGAMGYLQAYPYLGLEQRYAKSVAQYADSRLGLHQEKNPEKAIRTLVNDTPKYLVPNGGLSYWPKSQYSDVYLTYYVASLLLRYSPMIAGTEAVLSHIDPYMKTVFETSTLNHNRREQIQAFHYLAQRALQKKTPVDPGMVERVLKDSRHDMLLQKLMIVDALAGTAYQAQARALFETCLNNRLFQSGKMSFTDAREKSYSFMANTPLVTNLLALHAWLKLDPKNPQIPMLLRGIQGAQKENGYWRNTHENALAILGYIDYLQTAGGAKTGDFQVAVALNDRSLGTARYAGHREKLGLEQSSLSQLGTTDNIAISLRYKGRSPAFYRIALTETVSDTMDAKAQNAGFGVSRRYSDEKGREIRDNRFSPAAFYRVDVTMQINTPKDFVVLEDAVPAGFVVINPNLGSGSTVITERFGADQDAYYQKRWIAHSEYHANRVQAFGRDLQPGKYTLTYYVRAAYAGTFTLRSAMAQEMYAPEIEGRSAMGSITVRP